MHYTYFHIVLTVKTPLFRWDAYFYIGAPTLIVKRGKISYLHGGLFSQQDAHIYCENGNPGAHIHVNIGIGMPIFT